MPNQKCEVWKRLHAFGEKRPHPRKLHEPACNPLRAVWFAVGLAADFAFKEVGALVRPGRHSVESCQMFRLDEPPSNLLLELAAGAAQRRFRLFNQASREFPDLSLRSMPVLADEGDSAVLSGCDHDGEIWRAVPGVLLWVRLAIA